MSGKKIESILQFENNISFTVVDEFNERKFIILKNGIPSEIDINDDLKIKSIIQVDSRYYFLS